MSESREEGRWEGENCGGKRKIRRGEERRRVGKERRCLVRARVVPADWAPKAEGDGQIPGE